MEEARDRQELDLAIRLTERMFYKEYLNDICELNVPKDLEGKNNRIRLLKLNKFIFNEDEDNIEKITNVLTAINALNATYGYAIHSDGVDISIYLLVKTDDVTAIGKDTIYNGLIGNFPGIELENIYDSEMELILHNKLFNSNLNNIASLVTIPKEKSDKVKANIQGIEKFIDSMLGQEFTVLVLAESISSNTLKEIRSGYEDVFTMITPFKSTDFSFNENESESVSTSLAESITETVTNTTTKTNGISNTESSTNTVGGSVTIGTEEGIKLPFISAKVSASASANFSHAKTKGTTTTESDSLSEGTTKGNTNTDTKTTGTTKGDGRTYSFKTENKTINELLKRIDLAIERISQSEDVGLYNFGVYFLSNNKDTACRAATTYMGVVKGENSGLEKSYINTWDNEEANFEYVINNLKTLNHPIFMEENNTLITPTTLVNSRELARATNFPYKSVPGIPALNIRAFSRNISTYDKELGNKIRLGNIFHMGQVENTSVDIDVDSLTMHTFITGSTGSGKTNTCCKLIDEVIKNDVKVLIVEPAKGEYKNFFGENKGFNIFGTNPLKSDLLKINPFSFSKDIHILEHIDRLIEIFSMCWPLYAAMPAILKEAVEESYRKVGWDLKYSISSTGEFPTFNTLLEVLPQIINSSAYSEELKSNYIGSLVTRVKSLTNGLIGSIFIGEEINDKKLFEENTIVDFSRIGSAETKSLLMGIIFLKLYEYNMNRNQFTDKLRHLTVLEEAHNLLRKDSVSSSEGSNIQAKSVEMISNGIAEMRAYGEGFVIVDQAPSILDDSVIRNTNTKILLRLPDERDRRLTGKSALLNDEQIFEMARLRKGVGVVFQNNWLEPVLCKVDKFEYEKEFVLKSKTYSEINADKKKLIELLLSKTTGENREISLSESENLNKYINNEVKNKFVKKELIRLLEDIKNNREPYLFEKSNKKILTNVIAEVVDFKIQYEDIDRLEDLSNMTMDFCMKTNEVFGIDNQHSLELLKNILAYNAFIGEDSQRIIIDNWVSLYEGRKFL